MKKKVYLQCGYEDECKNKDCINCRKRIIKNVPLTYSEQVVIEDFAMCDLQAMINEKPKRLELMQDIMQKLMKKVFRGDNKKENDKKRDKTNK